MISPAVNLDALRRNVIFDQVNNRTHARKWCIINLNSAKMVQYKIAPISNKSFYGLYKSRTRSEYQNYLYLVCNYNENKVYGKCIATLISISMDYYERKWQFLIFEIRVCKHKFWQLKGDADR